MTDLQVQVYLQFHSRGLLMSQYE